ncbi:MAG: hypothetical protein NUW37_12495 [Planctomycetes bacterium]|nr:hypothetical protein [Planctomycetota bacterium]
MKYRIPVILFSIALFADCSYSRSGALEGIESDDREIKEDSAQALAKAGEIEDVAALVREYRYTDDVAIKIAMLRSIRKLMERTDAKESLDADHFGSLRAILISELNAQVIGVRFETVRTIHLVMNKEAVQEVEANFDRETSRLVQIEMIHCLARFLNSGDNIQEEVEKFFQRKLVDGATDEFFKDMISDRFDRRTELDVYQAREERWEDRPPRVTPPHRADASPEAENADRDAEGEAEE